MLDSDLLETEIGPDTKKPGSVRTGRLARFNLMSVNDERSGPCKLQSVEVQRDRRAPEWTGGLLRVNAHRRDSLSPGCLLVSHKQSLISHK